MNHGQSNSSVATTRMENTHGLTYSVARAIDITAWQSVDAICLCCLTHGACVKVTGLQPLPPTSHTSVMEMARGAVIFPSHLHDLQHVLDLPVCSMLVYYHIAGNFRMVEIFV